MLGGLGGVRGEVKSGTVPLESRLCSYDGSESPHCKDRRMAWVRQEFTVSATYALAYSFFTAVVRARRSVCELSVGKLRA